MKRAQGRISVIVPVYNKKQYLPECIESVLRQTRQELELLLVDDGSTDGSDALCEAYVQKDRRVRLIRQENGGPTAACETGMAQAQGDYFLFLDSDDYIAEEMLEKMAEHLEGRRGEVVCCNYVLEKRRRTQQVTMGAAPGVYEGEKLRGLKENLIGNEQRILPMSRCMKLCERSVFEGNERFYDRTIRMGDDFHLIFPALLSASRIVILQEAYFYHYRYVEDSIVHRYDEGMPESVRAWYHAMQRILAEKTIAEADQKLRREYCYMLMYVIKNELRNPGKEYAERIFRLFREDEEICEVVSNTPLQVAERTNQLMYLAMTRPSAGLLAFLRLLLRLHDR